MPDLSIDIETYSQVDLKTAGVYRYAADPSFDVLLIGYAIDEEEIKLIDYSDPECDDSEFREILTDPRYLKTAYNALFERVCLSRHFGLELLPADHWDDTMVLAASLGIPGNLAAVGEALGLERQKIEAGKELIRFFCKPTSKRIRNYKEHDPERWALFREYCKRDVDVERQIRRRLQAYDGRTAREHDLFAIDQRINDRGVSVDPVLIDHAIRCNGLYTDRILKEAQQMTGLKNPNSAAQLKGWLQKTGAPVTSLRKEIVPELIRDAEDESVRKVLQIRSELSKTSIAKYKAMESAMTPDERCRGLLQFYGAARTGRWAGRLIQVQNLPRNYLKDLDLARSILKEGDYELLEMLFGEPSGVLSQLIRTAFIPSQGCRFIVSDFSAIEARVIAWLAGEKWALEEFAGAGLIYEATAAAMFHVPKDTVKKGGVNEHLRSKGKVAVLACGYGGGTGALINQGALKMGVAEDELQPIIDHWRKANPHIVEYWSRVENAAIDAMSGIPTKLPHDICFRREDDWLFVHLPSGRSIAYFRPELSEEPRFRKLGLSYLGLSDKRKLTRLRTWGGKLVENIVQAVARDCLAHSMIRLENAGYPIVMHVHDEVIIDMPTGKGSLEEVQDIMGKPIPWAPGLPLRAAGFESDYYKKD